MSVDDQSHAILASVARMYYLSRIGQSEIASIYGVSRSTVSRMLTTARDRGIVRISVDDYDPRDRELEARIKAKLGLRDAVVVRTMGGDPERTRRAVGFFAAPFVAERVATHRFVGVAGGRTLADLVYHIEPREDGARPTFVQLLGVISSSPGRIDASEQCRALAIKFRGGFQTLNLPAYAQTRQARDLFIDHAEIRGVFGTFSRVELALVGLGTLEKSAFFERGVLQPADVDEIRAAGAVGEICGRFFNANGQECNTSFRERVIGVDLDVLRACPDVTAVMSGASRGDAVRAAVRGGIIKSLVVDQIGAQSILRAP